VNAALFSKVPNQFKIGKSVRPMQAVVRALMGLAR
jgi:hypothetical protein